MKMSFFFTDLTNVITWTW